MKEEAEETDDPYKDYRKAQRWRQNLFKKLCHKSVDIPEDDMGINVQKGITWKEMLAAGVILLALVFVGGKYLTPPVTLPVTPSQKATQEYEVRFFDSEGNEIHVPQADTAITEQ